MLYNKISNDLFTSEINTESGVVYIGMERVGGNVEKVKLYAGSERAIVKYISAHINNALKAGPDATAVMMNDLGINPDKLTMITNHKESIINKNRQIDKTAYSLIKPDNFIVYASSSPIQNSGLLELLPSYDDIKSLGEAPSVKENMNFYQQKYGHLIMTMCSDMNEPDLPHRIEDQVQIYPYLQRIVEGGLQIRNLTATPDLIKDFDEKSLASYRNKLHSITNQGTVINATSILKENYRGIPLVLHGFSALIGKNEFQKQKMFLDNPGQAEVLPADDSHIVTVKNLDTVIDYFDRSHTSTRSDAPQSGWQQRTAERTNSQGPGRKM